MSVLLAEPTGQGWTQLVELGVALVLSALVGLERQTRRKSAGLRTHTIIGFSAALFMLVSKYGFTDVLAEHVVLDPSRVAAQIVSGIGFVGGGLIFVRRDAVRGLTTAAAVWLSTAIGMAAGAGLLVLATAATAAYFVVVYGFTPLAARAGGHPQGRVLEIVYLDGQGLLRELLGVCTRQGWSIDQLDTDSRSSSHTRYLAGESHEPAAGPSHDNGHHDVHGSGHGRGHGSEEPGALALAEASSVSVRVVLHGTDTFEDLVAELAGHPGVLSVSAGANDHDTAPDSE